jgi:hypothetical protein
MMPAIIVIGFVVTIVVIVALLTLTGRAFFFLMDGDLWWRGGLRPLTFIFAGIILLMMVIIALAQRGEFASP